MRTSSSRRKGDGESSPAVPPSVRGFGLPRQARILRPHEFRRVYGRGRRATGQLIVVVGARRRDPGHRLGLSVSKEHGTAVRRNKLKRVLREAFRLERPTLPGRFDLVLIPRPREGRLVLDEVRRELSELVEQLDVQQEAPRRSRRRGRRRP